jgi:DnaJ-class molecular chaperone
MARDKILFCSPCHGTGRNDNGEKCTACNGKGYIREKNVEPNTEVPSVAQS